MIAEMTATLSVLGIGALIVAALVARLPVGTCSECPHCRAAAIEDAAEQRRLREEYERLARIPPRLWGRPSDDEERDDDGERR